IGRNEAELDPFADRLDDLGDAHGAVGVCRRMHFDCPRLAGTPAFAGELFRGRGKRVRYRAPDVDASVAIEVEGVFVELRWQELREAHGAAPGRAQIRTGHAILKHLQRMQKLVAEEILALADISLRGEHPDGVLAAKFAREAAFARPDR